MVVSVVLLEGGLVGVLPGFRGSDGAMACIWGGGRTVCWLFAGLGPERGLHVDDGLVELLLRVEKGHQEVVVEKKKFVSNLVGNGWLRGWGRAGDERYEVVSDHPFLLARRGGGDRGVGWGGRCLRR